MKIPDSVLIIDTETEMIPTENVLEIGVVLYSVKHQAVQAIASTLIPTSWGNNAEKINKIPPNLLSEASQLLEGDVRKVFARMQTIADVFIAHNAEFDYGMLSPDKNWASRPWLCTKSDFMWQRARPGLSLRDLALEYGVGVASAHRAVTDCLLIAEIFNRLSRDEIETEFLLALREKFWYRAAVDFKENQLAKDAGFRWDGEKKLWVKKMAEADTAMLPFKVHRLKDQRALRVV